MSRGHNGRRRRSYGRRQHEVRERRDLALPREDSPPEGDEVDWGFMARDDESTGSSRGTWRGPVA